jgi:hypothetical protein
LYRKPGPPPIRNPESNAFMKLRKLMVPLLAQALLAAGCNQYLIREGIWELSLQAEVSGSQEVVPIPKRLVRVTLGPSDDGEGEVAKITPVAESPTEGADAAPARTTGAPNTDDPATELKPMYASITRKLEGEEPLVQVDHSDTFWIWRMWGRVRDQETIVGVHFGARHKAKYVVLEGRWGMRWIRDS